MEHQFQYYAFISYKREDEKWAKWLQDQLRWYKLPTKLCKQVTRLPKRVWPIFRDNTDLDSGILEQNIRGELERSQFLIVVCSPEAARSPWVGKEVEHFVSLGRADKIIPFVVSGVPYSNNPETECVHQRIKAACETELLAVNVNEEGVGSKAMKKRRAFIRIVARLLDIKFNALWQPYERTLKLRRWCVGIAATIVLLVLFGVWDYNRTKYEYYADYVDRWGLPEGVVELSKAQVKHRNGHYRFEYTKRSMFLSGKGILKRVVFANSAGYPKEHSDIEYFDRSSIQQIDIQTDKQGRQVIEIEYQNSKTKPVIVATIAGDSLQHVDLKSIDKGNGAVMASSLTSVGDYLYSGNISISSIPKSEIRRYRLYRNEHGLIMRKLFKRNNGNDSEPICDHNGIWGFEYMIDNIGRPKKIIFLGFDGKMSQNRLGIASKGYDYDDFGNIYKIYYLNKEGKLTINEHLWAITQNVSNNDGNIVETVSLDENSQSCFHKEGFAKRTIKYDYRGNIKELAYIDINNNPCLNNDGFSFCSMKYDSRGNIEETAYFDTNNNPCLNNDWCAKWVAKYNEENLMIEFTVFDINNKPCLNKDGYYKKNAVYDRWTCIEETYYDTTNEPCLNKNGTAKIVYKFDKQDRLVYQVYLDKNNCPIQNKDGIVGEIYHYDEKGVLDSGLNILGCRDSVFTMSGTVFCYDKDGRVFGETILGQFPVTGIIKEGELVNMPNINPSTLKKAIKEVAGFKYDEKGNIINIYTFSPDLSGNLCNNNFGYAIEEYSYDEKGNIIKQCFYDANNNRCLNNDNFHATIYEYDEYGNIIMQEFRGIDYNLITNKYGYAKRTAKYDEKRNRIEESCFDIYEVPCIDNVSKIVTKYTERGLPFEKQYFGANRDPCLCTQGFAKYITIYDDRNKILEQSYFNTNNNCCLHKDGFAKYTSKYDERGNIVEVSFRGIDGKLRLNKDGFAKYTSRYDEYGNIIERCYFGEDGGPCLTPKGYAKWTAKYTRYAMCEFSCFGIDNNPSMCIDGYARWESKCKGKDVETLYFNTDGILCNNKSGYAKRITKFNDYHDILSIKCYDTSEKVVNVDINYNNDFNQAKNLVKTM